ncbi:hypothetical protein [Sinosporangium album]|nr:hypothetical protein [Sinosporangium album]
MTRRPPDDHLDDLIEEDAASVRWELLRGFGGETTGQKIPTPPTP